MRYCTPYKTIDVITYPYYDPSWYLLITGAPDEQIDLEDVFAMIGA